MTGTCLYINDRIYGTTSETGATEAKQDVLSSADAQRDDKPREGISQAEGTSRLDTPQGGLGSISA
jgi:hypothetical protein